MDTPDSVEAQQEQKGFMQNTSREDVIRRVQTADSVWIPKDVFEKLYLNPERSVPGDLRRKVIQPVTYP